MRKRLCPTCGKPVPAGEPCPRCGARKYRRTPEQERERNARNPTRKSYGSAEYRRNRQIALDITGGRCAMTGVRIAEKIGGEWSMLGNGGVHHVVPLSEGGTDDLSNLMPLCTKAHALVEAELRRTRRNRARYGPSARCRLERSPRDGTWPGRPGNPHKRTAFWMHSR